MIALIITLSRAVSSGLKPTPSSMNGDRRPRTMMLAAVDVVDPGDALQQRALAAAVAADDAEELALRDLDVDVVDRLQHVEGPRAERMQGPLLERVVLPVGELEALGDAVQRHRERPRALHLRGDRWGGAWWSRRTLATTADDSASGALRARRRPDSAGCGRARTLQRATAGTVAQHELGRQEGLPHVGLTTPQSPCLAELVDEPGPLA